MLQRMPGIWAAAVAFSYFFTLFPHFFAGLLYEFIACVRWCLPPRLRTAEPISMLRRST